ncbi:hypothetical protein TUM20983_27990 [Mycobacterium antarcticum]|uniref:cellulase family glycosylhydrolase n=1 Tax=unclassified Mycolicibacterium TaxID=2636767 RepID=UPI002384D48F|nr:MULTISPECIES: cellulase family glycosylhydrolase [unclassified Mycolicibacterium]GLP75689.1 hypothetical protein TUM20983_27990 [Mycolicibacterium sp. TUM20983]GLP83968.1 hypothetical protein TUM20984_53880 [Mycolicibacterium sp. TUM20984]
MRKTAKGMLRTLATRTVVAAIPVAMVGAYAGNLLVPTPPRMAEYAYQQVAEITVSPDTVGIAASPLYGQTKAQIDAQLDQMQALGVENIRVFVPWALLDFAGPSAAGSATWAQLDLVMQSAKERDMGVMAEINSTPPYAVTAGFPGSGTPDPAAFATFMSKFVAQYGNEVSAYEIWNEPNSIQFSNPIDPAAYAALLKAAYPVIKSADPTATVVAGAVGHVFTTGFTMDPVDFVQAMIAADPTIGQYFDALSYHPYDEGLPFSAGNVDPNAGGFASDTAYNQVKDLMALFPTKKVWISEFGVPTYSYVDANGAIQTVTQAQQAALIKDLIESWGSLGQAGPIFLYTGRDTLTGDGVADDNYGLWTTTGAPKAVIDFLTTYFAAHPQNPGTGGPTDPGTGGGGTPTDAAAALAAAFQVLAQQIAQAIAQAVAQAFAQTLAQQIANAVVTAIANGLASLGQPQPVTTAAPLSLRVASVESTEAADTNATTPAKTAVTADATTPVAAEAIAPDAEPMATKPEATTAAVVEAVVPESAAAEPAPSTAPVVTPPEAAKPEVTKSEVATPEATKPASTPSDTGTSAGVEGGGSSPSETRDDDKASAPKPDDRDKPASAQSGSAAAGKDTSGVRKSEQGTRPSKDKGDKGSASEGAPKGDPAPSAAAAGAVGAGATTG